MREIVVLGGGYGGILTAKGLGKQLKKNRDVRITLIDRNPFHTLLTELHEVAAGRVEEDSIKVDLKKIFAGFKNVDVVQDEILNIDFNAKTIKGTERSYSYEYLVIGTGSKPTFFGIEGAEQNAFTLWSFEDAIRLKDQILQMFRLAVTERDAVKRKELLTFVVVGAGFTGVEMIGELGEYVQELCKEHHINRSEVNLYVVDMMDKILPIMPDALIRKAEKRLLKLGVKTVTRSRITAVKENSVVLGDREIAARTVIWTAGVEGSDLAANLDVEQKGRARLLTNDKLQLPDRNEVYVVGDNIFYIPEGATAPVPQMVENAEAAAPLIAHNIAAEFLNKPKKSYKPTFHGMMVSIGSRYGVAHVGLPNMMFKLSGFMAMLSKHMINMLYLFQICGFNKVYSYLLHEIFHVRNRRSFVGGYLSKRSPNFWLVPLRMFVGFMWLSEGWEKLNKIIDDPNKIFLIPASPNDATAAASAAEGAVEIAALPVWGWLSNIVDWSMNTFFYTSDYGFSTLAYVFQTGMVCAEIVFGLMLIGGLFTAPVAIMTFAMGAMIWVSGMAPLDMLWYMVASIALIGGSGSTFGLDYYVYPWLKKVWRKLPIIKRFYLYAD
ncbi:MAG: FAD-dependent oxidoreductase [Gorillibacterium sp.]|nr:FAD-dependent oxidoreductase [Gorillibacterium sp.]